MPERKVTKECDILKAVEDIRELYSDVIDDLPHIENIENFLYNLKHSSSFAHKAHIVLRDS